MAANRTRSIFSLPRPTVRRWPPEFPRAARRPRRCSSSMRRPARRSPGRSIAPISAQPSWSEDSRTLYFIRLKALAPGAPSTDNYLDATFDAWNLDSAPGADPRPNARARPAVRARGIAGLDITPGAPLAPSRSRSTARRTKSRRGRAPVATRCRPELWTWQPFVTRDDGVTSIAMRGDDIYPAVARATRRCSKCSPVRAGAPLASANDARRHQTGSSDRIDSRSGRCAVCARPLEGGYSRLLRIANGSTEATDVPLPYHRLRHRVFTDPLRNGVMLTHESWTVPPVTYALRSRRRRVQAPRPRRAAAVRFGSAFARRRSGGHRGRRNDGPADAAADPDSADVPRHHIHRSIRRVRTVDAARVQPAH